MARELWTLWGSFVIAVFLYPTLAYFFLTSGEPNRDMLFLAVFAIFALGNAIASVVVRINILNKKLDQGAIDLSSEEGKQKCKSLHIICWALAETSAIMGICWVVIANDFILSLPFYGVSLIAFALNLPRTGNQESKEIP
ncbi:hypothetical protein GF373_09655 [bacterium]|nr:hypothetical protein [bacterium]